MKINQKNYKFITIALVAIVALIIFQTYNSNTVGATYTIRQNGVNYEAVRNSDNMVMNWTSPDAAYVITMTSNVGAPNKALAIISSSTNNIYVQGTLYCDSTIVLNVEETNLYSDGNGKLIFNNVDGILITTNKVTVQNIELDQASYARTKIGISLNGQSDNAFGYETLDNVKIWGWNSALQMSYIWSSTISRVDTTFSLNALLIYGQSVNNAFTNCHFSNYAKNTATILLQKDTVTGAQPEGNNFVNCFVYGGTFGFELINAAYTQIGSGCNIDGWSTTGVYVVQSPNTQVSSGVWVGSTFSTEPGIKLEASTNVGIVGADINVPSGSGVVLTSGSTFNRVSDCRIVAAVGIQEMSYLDDYNQYSGNTITGPYSGNNIIIRGTNSVRGTNIPMTG
jgi:hypothetical protein